MKTTFGLLMIGLLVFSFFSVAYAERYVVVNGKRLSIPEIQYVEQVHCGPIPNGRYWINLQTGLWGYEGNPGPRGILPIIAANPNDGPACQSEECSLARTIGSGRLTSGLLFLSRHLSGASW